MWYQSGSGLWTWLLNILGDSMTLQRASGILLHPTALPGRFGIGDLGDEAYAFVDFLASTGQSYWQVLPLGPTGYGDSPYQCFSAFAGNALLISPNRLVEDGLLANDEVERFPHLSSSRVDFGRVIECKRALLGKAFYHFKGSTDAGLHADFLKFCRENNWWLEDYALF